MPKPRGPFRPASQYPADPYAQSSSPASERTPRSHKRAPWTLDLDALETLQEPQRSVILILGDPSPLALKPLLAIKSIAASLLIVASSRPSLDLPQSESTPEIRLLPIEPESTQEGAARVAGVMKSAEKIARQWRREIADAEQPAFGPLSHPPTQRARLSLVHSNNSQLLTPPATPRMRSISRLPRPRDRQSFINQQRALDMVINFLPNANAKGIIKEAILVTTIVKPSLFPLSPTRPGMYSSGVTEPPLSRVPSTAEMHIPSRWSRVFSGSRTSLALSSNPRCQSPASLSPSTPAPPARIIHILPFTYLPPPQGPFAHAHLIRKLEAFLLDFSYSPAAMKLNSSPNMPKSSERLRPFLLGRSGLTETMRIRRQEYTLGDLVLGGLLDSRPEHSQSRPVSGASADSGSEHSEAGWTTGRAWLGGVSDISLQTPGISGLASTAVASSPSSGTQSAPASAPPSPQTTAAPAPPRPLRNDARDARRTISLGNAEPRPNISVPVTVPTITINNKREPRNSLPTPPDSSDSDSHTNYTEFWAQHDSPSAGTSVSLNELESTHGSIHKPMPPTPNSPTVELAERRKSKVETAKAEGASKRKWWSWGRGRKTSTHM
ncbi:unnamed protein product [Rhizoctonia solani]|uniref:Uncharacterized protein n=1 Tax=Rhizoctonia solani TaxID=456999 RepID=A0A8H3DA42_9AGAM|nr:unnamed protein product [Rhizoctonia solani]